MKAARQFEQQRLNALEEYDVLDSPSPKSFDLVTRLVKNAVDVPIAGVTLVDAHRQWQISRQGPIARESARDGSFCNVAIRLDEPLVVEDATRDPRFEDSPFVLGAPFIRAYAGVQLRSPNGLNIGTLCAIDTRPRQFDPRHMALMQDLSHLVMSEFEAQKLATIDPLTGALSRRGFRSEGERALGLAVRHNHPLSCIAIDLDHFKSVNDRYGHAAGDRLLMATAELCRDRLRVTDIFGRVGGEEFVILLPHTDLAGAIKVAEATRLALAARAGIAGLDQGRATASFGIATHDSSVATLDELLRRADEALYGAKEAGARSVPGSSLQLSTLTSIVADLQLRRPLCSNWRLP